jgi:hypothetical protein
MSGRLKSLMRLTPEQQEIVNKAKTSGEKRATVSFTSEQKAEWQAAVQQELDGRDETISLLRKIRSAAEQPGFFGDVRRAIAISNRRVDDLARDVGVDLRLLSEFRAGEADLPSAALDRLLDILGLRLMIEIRR